MSTGIATPHRLPQRAYVRKAENTASILSQGVMRNEFVVTNYSHAQGKYWKISKAIDDSTAALQLRTILVVNPKYGATG